MSEPQPSGPMTPIIAAIITATAVILAALIAVFREDIFSLLRWKSRDWSGLWTGEVYSYDTKIAYQVTARLKQVGRTITGTITSQSPEVLEYTIKGTVHEPEYMTYHAVNSDKKAVNYLVGINHFDRRAKEISGKFLARSRLVQRISAGSIRLVPSR